jgi:pyruvate kinase
MVARGDLGVQIPSEQIPLVQKEIINICRRTGKPIITATQMLDSMIVNPRPTRAELTDVANAILDGTDAIMLSGETSAGAYPVEAVKTMDKIARTVEASDVFRSRMANFNDECFSNIHRKRESLGIVMARSGVEIAEDIEAKVIVTPTNTGNTARILSVFRPNTPIFAVTPNEKAVRYMQLYWGVRTFLRPYVNDTETMIQNAIQTVSETGVGVISDKLVIVAGLPLNSPNMVNNVRVVTLGTILAHCSSGGYASPSTTKAHGKIIHALKPFDVTESMLKEEPKILVCKVLGVEYTALIPHLKGIICEHISDFHENELHKLNPHIVWLTNIRDASKKLETGITVTIDANEFVVYEGIY